jgi:hypothetical protein
VIVNPGEADDKRFVEATSRETRDQVSTAAGPRDALERDCAEVRAYAAGFVKILGPVGQTWENMAPLMRNGWAVRHDEVCVRRHDWRLSWPAARDGWREAGGAFDPPPPLSQDVTSSRL